MVMVALIVAAVASMAAADEWPTYGRDPGGSRFSPLRQITRENVGQLRVAWTFHTGEAADTPPARRTAFAATPILVDGTVFVSTPRNRVVALDPQSGEPKWIFDAKLSLQTSHLLFTSRGVSSWLDEQRQPAQPCRRRIFMGTMDARLISLDAATGEPCADFGNGGVVDLRQGLGPIEDDEYSITSPPAIARDLVIVGSEVTDSMRADGPSGVVRALDARSGALRWKWEAIPPAQAAVQKEGPYRTGSPNAWSVFSVDEERDLVVIPTGNPNPNYYGARRRDEDRFGSSVVALRASTGALVWSFQTVHHDLWDYDVPAQPVLLDLRREAVATPVVVQATKMGHLFVLDRMTGVPVFPVEERPVPVSGVLGETSAVTQPFPVAALRFGKRLHSPTDAWGVTEKDRVACAEQLAALDNEGTFTPPSLNGSLQLPGPAGGMHWGGVAFDPERQIVVTNYNNLPFAVRLIPRAQLPINSSESGGFDPIWPQLGTPYAMGRKAVLSPRGLPCIRPPWGKLAAVELASATVRWDVALGTVRPFPNLPLDFNWGTQNLGGAITTASGLVFVGATTDQSLRAFDIDTGVELWKGRLPASGHATPMTYEYQGKQFVVIAAGGHSLVAGAVGDALVAFALP